MRPLWYILVNREVQVAGLWGGRIAPLVRDTNGLTAQDKNLIPMDQGGKGLMSNYGPREKMVLSNTGNGLLHRTGNQDGEPRHRTGNQNLEWGNNKREQERRDWWAGQPAQDRGTKNLRQKTT